MNPAWMLPSAQVCRLPLSRRRVINSPYACESLDRMIDALQPLAELFDIGSVTLAIPINTLVPLLAFPLPEEIDLLK